jgi:hypothetical protein
MSGGDAKRLEGQGREHLFKPGKSGNPGGRPKTKSLSKAYRQQLESICPTDAQARTWAEVIAERTAVAAAKGNVQAAVELADRVEGKVRLALAEVDDEFAEMSVEELEAELERTTTEHSGDADTKTPDPRGYTQ